MQLIRNQQTCSPLKSVFGRAEHGDELARIREWGFLSSVTEGQRVRQTTASAAAECVVAEKNTLRLLYKQLI